MKVLLINNDKGWSGGQEFLRDLAQELLESGVAVHFLVRAGSRSETRFRETGLPVHSLPGHGFGDLVALFRLAGILRRERFDIVSVNREHDILLTAVARAVAFPLRKHGKLLVTYHCGTSRKQHFLFFAAAVICVSEHVRRKLCERNPAAMGKAVIINNGILSEPPPDDAKFRVYREKRFFKGESFPLIGMLGEFFKNQMELVDAVPFLKEEFPGLKIAFVGDTADTALVQPLLDKIRRLGLEGDFLFTGRVPRERIPDVFFDFDLSVSTYRNEGYGLVHLESLSAGTPVVAYNEGGVVDILRGEDVGLLVDGGPQGIAEAVACLLKDHERRFTMGRRGHEMVSKKFSRAAMGAGYLDIYRRILENR